MVPAGDRVIVMTAQHASTASPLENGIDATRYEVAHGIEVNP